MQNGVVIYFKKSIKVEWEAKLGSFSNHLFTLYKTRALAYLATSPTFSIDMLNSLLLLWNGPEQLAAREEMLRQKTSRVKTSIFVMRSEDS